MPLDRGPSLEYGNSTVNATLNELVSKSASHPGCYAKSPSKQNKGAFRSLDCFESKMGFLMPAEASDEHSLSTECEEDTDYPPCLMSTSEDDFQGVDADMNSCKSSSSVFSNSLSVGKESMSIEKPVEHTVQETDIYILEDQSPLDKQLLKRAACAQVWKDRELRINETQICNGRKMADRMLHEVRCMGCLELLCQIIKRAKDVLRQAEPSSDGIHAMLEFSTLIHSTSCNLLGCPVQGCTENKEDIRDCVNTFLQSSTYEVLESRCSLFTKGQFLTLHKDLVILAEDYIDNGSHGEVSAAHLYHPASGAEALMALKRSIPRSTKDIVQRTVHNYPAHREAEIHAMLSGHPNVVSPTLISYNQSSGSTMILMEKYDCSLFDFVEKYKEEHNALMTIGEASYYFREVLTGLCHLHQHGIIHKDVKPKNVLLKNGFQNAALTDFDASQIVGDGSFKHQFINGTKGFIAPEVERKEAHGKPADVFSACNLFLDLLFGLAENETQETRSLKVQLMRKEGGAFEEMANLLARGLSSEPSERPTALELLESDALRALIVDGLNIRLNMSRPTCKRVVLDGPMVVVATEEVVEVVHKRLGVPEEEYLKALERLPRDLPRDHRS